MAKFSDVNTSYATGAEAMFAFMTTLEAAGWIVEEESDGTTYEADVPGNGHQITSGAAGAGGLANSNAWFRIREPETNGREYTVQRDTVNNHQYRIKMSAAAGFTGGTPGATQTPSATDEQVFNGGGTDAAPTHSSILPSDGTYRIHIIAESTPVGPAGNRVYGFWVWTTGNGGGGLSTLWVQEAMAVGSYVPLVGTRTAPTDGDADPAMYICTTNNSAFSPQDSGVGGWAGNSRGNNSPMAWYDYGGGSAAFGECRAINMEIQTNTNTYFGQTMGTGAYGYDVGHPCTVINGVSADGSRIGMKGITTRMYCSGTARSYPDTINLSTDAYCYTSILLLPYEDGTAPLL